LIENGKKNNCIFKNILNDIAVYNTKNFFCMKHAGTIILLIILFAGQAIISIAQPGSTIELPNKPKPYQDRTLPAERTQDKKYNTYREMYQDMVTHYNYYFNANARLNIIINSAKANFKDDYTSSLLPFYNYSLDVTASNKKDIDSIIYRCAEGVLLHDLRNDFIDDMYFLLGRAYFLRKNFDSSANCFRYINYAWAPKDQGYDIPVGSNASATNGEFSIATKESKSFLKKISGTKPPARNDALLALCRNYIETGNFTQASSLLEILRNDPNFPARLQPQLNETLSYWYYKQNNYDSAAAHLSKALGNAANNFEESRWEFLIGQLYQLSHDSARAIAYYDKCINLTPNPVMQVYANLDIIDLTGSNNKGNVMQLRLDNLLKLAKKDRYALYRDIIYYAAAKVEMQMKDTSDAVAMLKKSIAASVNSPKQKSLSFLMLADITYDRSLFIPAHNYYDSVSLGQITKQEDYDRTKLRQSALKIIAANLTQIHLEDSLQVIAAMSPAAREAFLKKLAKQLEKMQEADLQNQQNPSNATAGKPANASGLFGNTASSTTGWYFNNPTLLSSGFTSFRQNWGNRPNVDNWNLKSDIDKLVGAKTSSSLGDSTKHIFASTQSLYNSLLSKIPLTPEMMKISNNNIAKALFGNGGTFENQLENYPAALASYNELNRRFGKSDYTEQTLYNESYCYTKVGNKPAADSCIAALKNQYSEGKFTQSLTQGKEASVTSDANPATKEYDHIYDLFLSGSFDSANAEKSRADSVYGKTYWTPQLLFIEAVYYVSLREDSAAINKLHNLATLYPKSPLADRANTMIDVLKRRKQIESYLTSLQIKRNEDDAGPVVNLTSTKTTTTRKEIPKQDSVVNKSVTTNTTVIKKDTTAAVAVPKSFSINASDPQYVLIVLDSVAPVFANEAGNAFTRYNMQYYYNQTITVTTVKLNARYNLVLLGPFPDALGATQYIDKTKPMTAGKILPWLTPNKFTYSMISQSNLDLLKSNSDIDGYKKLLHQALPQEF
jgi:tetratricopeptide (TPR) repeat protein